MANYLIIGGDGKEYGPVSDADVRQWIAEGRVNAQSQAKAESDAEFRPLSAFPEFADALSLKAPPAIEPPSPASSAPFVPQDYDLDISDCVSRGYQLLKENFGVLFVAALIYFIIEAALSGLANIPLIGPLFSIANFIITGPLMGGLFYLFIRVNRGEPADVGGMFDGFRRAFGQLFLGVLVPGLFIFLCMLPVIIIFIIKLIPVMSQMQHHGPESEEAIRRAATSILFTALPVMFICAIPVVYLSTCWKFTLPLIVDQEMDFWTAMKTSFKMVNKHWWQIFGLILIIGLLNIAGLCACCIGVLFTFPIGLGALMVAYDKIFTGRNL